MRFLSKILNKAKGAFQKMKSKFDKQGAYTGTPDAPEDDRPEQDADDL